MSSKPNSSTQAAPAVGAQTPAHQLPPVAHAIAGSVGSALSILAFYPLERVLVEMQSQRGGGSMDVCNGKTGFEYDGRSNDYKRKDGTDGNGDHKEGTTVAANVTDHSHLTVKPEGHSSSSDSSDILLEFVSSLRSDDVVSFDMLSFDDNSANNNHERGNNIVDDDEKMASVEPPSPKYKSVSQPFSLFGIMEKCSNARDSSVNKHQNIETIFQCLLRLHKEQTLYKGVGHMVTTLMISNAIFFYALQVTRQGLANLQQHQVRPGNIYHNILPKSKVGTSLIASSLAGAVNVIFTNPLWVASLRIMEANGEMIRHSTLWSVICQITHNEGFYRLWNGAKTSLLLVSNPIIQHFIYEQLRSRLLESRAKRAQSKHGHGRERHVLGGAASLSPLEAFIFGALAKATATVATYPLQLAQALLRLQKKKIQSPPSSNSNDNRHGSVEKHVGREIVYEGTLDCLYRQFSCGGLPALFQGMNAKLLQTVLTSALTFLTYEQTLGQVGRLYANLGEKLQFS